MEKIKNTKQDTELVPTPMTKKDTSRRMYQLQIEFPGQEKYWTDSNFVFVRGTIKEISGR